MNLAIQTESLPILDTYKHLSLSCDFNNIDDIIVGDWLIVGLKKDSVEYISFQKNGKVAETSLDKQGWKCDKGWDLVIHNSKRMTRKNSFNVIGIGTIEIIYADKNIIYSLGYNNRKIFFINDKSIQLFNSNEHIIKFFSSIENRWLSEMGRIKGITYEYDYIINDSVLYWGPAIIGYIIGCVVANGNDIVGIITFVIASLTLSVIARIVVGLKKKKHIREYLKKHPNDKLAYLELSN